jgi:chromosome segregation ATPase
MGEVRREMNQTEEAVGLRVGPLEQAALGLAGTTDRTSRVESDVAGLREGMADGSAKVEEVRREVAGLNAQLSDDCPNLNQDLRNLERELATLKEEMRELGGLKAAMADQRQRHEQEIRDVKHEVELLRKASERCRRWRRCERSLGSWRASLRPCDRKTVMIGQESGKLPERTSSCGPRPLD